MSKSFTRGALVLASLSVVALSVAQETKINFTPKAGTSAEWDSVVTLTVDGMPLTVKAIHVRRILEVKSDGNFVMQNDVRNMRMEMPGIEAMPMPEMAPSIATFDRTGVLLGVTQEGTSPEDLLVGARMLSIGTFHYPENLDRTWKPGESYNRIIPANSKIGTKALQAQYTFEGTEKVGEWESAIFSFRVSESGVDKPQRMTGKAYIALSDGMVTKIEAKFSDMVSPGAPDPMSGTISLVRIK
jgi:hypothetical protein